MFSIESLFQYNWQIRDEWFEILEPIAEIELFRERNAGIGSIMKTLFHIIDVEYSWIRAIKNEPDVTFDCEEYKDIKSMRTLSDKLRIEIKELLTNWSMDMEYEMVTPGWDDDFYFKGEILRHIIVHEIHHIGQLSIWSKEIGIPVISTSFIGKKLLQRN